MPQNQNIMTEECSKPRSSFSQKPKTIIELIFLHPLTQPQLMERGFGRQCFHDLDGDPTSKNLQNTRGIFNFGMPN